MCCFQQIFWSGGDNDVPDGEEHALLHRAHPRRPRLIWGLQSVNQVPQRGLGLEAGTSVLIRKDRIA